MAAKAYRVADHPTPVDGTTDTMPTPPSFATDIQPLFRDSDRRAMRFMFDLWDHEEVVANAGDILTSVAGGDMPCDGSWPKERIELLRAWIAGGCQP